MEKRLALLHSHAFDIIEHKANGFKEGKGERKKVQSSGHPNSKI
jgi:hypothetical protein